MSSPTPFESLKTCVERAGSQAKLAQAMGVSQTAVWKWLQSSKRLPAEYVLRAEQLYGVSRHDLRPDIYPRNYPPAPDARWLGIDHGAIGGDQTAIHPYAGRRVA